MEEREFLESIADSVTDQPHVFTVTIQHPTRWESVLLFFKLIKRQRTFKLKPLVLGKMVLISKLVLRINVKDFTKKTLYDRTNRLVVDSSYDLANIVAIAVCTQRRPPDRLIDFFYDNLSMKQLKEAAKVVIDQTDLTSFLSGIISIKGLNVLEMNPESVEEQPIASTDTLEPL